jgi:flagellin
MAISLANNLLANSVALNLNKNQAMLASSVSKLSSGLRINTAADDPSGLAIAEKLQSQVNGFDQAVSNVQDATNAATTADGALQTTTDILQRVRSLAVEASNDTNTTADKGNLQTEVTQLLQEVNTISQNTSFNGSSLLDGSHAGFQAAQYGTAGATTNGALAAGGALVSVTPLASGAAFSSVAATSSMVDGTIELQVVNNNGTANVTSTFIGSSAATSGGSSGTSVTTQGGTVALDGVTVTTGSFTLADVGVTSYIKVSQYTAAVSSGTTPAFSFHSGAAEGAAIQLGIASTSAASLRISNINLLISTSANNSAGAEDAIGQIDFALQTLLTQRANLGAVMVRLQEDSSNDSVAATNLQASESNIRDLNVSAETTKYSADQILISVGTSVLLQSNNNAQSVEKLFQ